MKQDKTSISPLPTEIEMVKVTDIRKEQHTSKKFRTINKNNNKKFNNNTIQLQP